MAREQKYGEIEIPNVPADEPVFIFRAQDLLALPAIGFYAKMRRNLGDIESARKIDEALAEMAKWPVKKMPD